MALQLKRILEERKMSVLALSKASGITQANLSKIVNGKASPRLEILERIAGALEIETYRLLQDEESPCKQSVIVCPHCGREIKIKVE